MTLEDAINTSLIHAARGYDEKNKCVVSVAYYGDDLMWQYVGFTCRLVRLGPASMQPG